MYKTKTAVTLSNGFLTMSNPPFVMLRQRVFKCLPLLLVIPPLFKKCLNECQNNSLLCLKERLSCIGILVRK